MLKTNSNASATTENTRNGSSSSKPSINTSLVGYVTESGDVRVDPSPALGELPLDGVQDSVFTGLAVVSGIPLARLVVVPLAQDLLLLGETHRLDDRAIGHVDTLTDLSRNLLTNVIRPKVIDNFLQPHPKHPRVFILALGCVKRLALLDHCAHTLSDRELTFCVETLDEEVRDVPEVSVTHGITLSVRKRGYLDGDRETVRSKGVSKLSFEASPLIGSLDPILKASSMPICLDAIFQTLVDAPGELSDIQENLHAFS
jgi:hypothetical protein